MAQPIPSSPAWKKPSDVMKVRLKGKKRRSVSLASHNQANIQAKSYTTNNQENATTGETRAGKRRNPFGQSSSDRGKKRAHSEVLPGEIEGANHNELFQALDADGEEVFQETSNASKNESSPNGQDRLKPEVNSSNQHSQETNSAPKTSATSQTSNRSSTTSWKKTYPVDWCLKTRVRFMSDSPFTWCGTLKTNEEASGLSWFVRGTHHDESVSDSPKDSQIQSNWRSRLHQSAMVWMHPCLPWVKLYPRIHSEDKKTRPSFAANDEVFQNSLMANWCESFRSLFHQLRAGHCPYFYLCGYQGTVLFRAAGVAGFKHVHAFLSPTTKGLRETLKAEGIDLSMPLCPAKDSISSEPDDRGGETSENSGASSNPQVLVKNEEEEDEEDEEDFNQGDDAASSWLQSMGLDKQSFPTLDPRRVKFQRDESVKFDNRPQSLVLISGSSTQALYNFLLNSDIMVASTGSQACIPPTLLAPAAFEGATLVPCKVKSGKLQQAVGNKIQECFSLEVTGPILPSNIHAMTQLLATSQQDGFTASIYNHDPTMMFSAVQSQNVVSLQERRSKLINCNLSPELLDYLTQGDDPDDHGTIRELACTEGLYSWTSYT